jgi:hypothetical protein
MFLALNSQVTFYASYLGFNYVNTIGFILICLYVIQLLSGLQLSLYYNYSLSYYAFDSIQFIMKDVNIGNIIRIFHIIGSSFYMLFLWLHLLRGLFIKLFFYSFIVSKQTKLSVFTRFFNHKKLSSQMNGFNSYSSFTLIGAPDYKTKSSRENFAARLLTHVKTFGFGFSSIFSYISQFYCCCYSASLRSLFFNFSFNSVEKGAPRFQRGACGSALDAYNSVNFA